VKSKNHDLEENQAKEEENPIFAVNFPGAMHERVGATHHTSFVHHMVSASVKIQRHCASGRLTHSAQCTGQEGSKTTQIHPNSPKCCISLLQVIFHESRAEVNLLHVFFMSFSS